MTATTNKDPLIHFPFYINQYQGLLSGYSFLEKGAFIALLCVYLSEDGKIPEDLNKLFRMAGAFNQDEQVALSLVKDEVIRLGLEILKKQRKVREKNRQKASKAANKRWSKGNATSIPTSIPEAMLEECHTETDTETDTEIKKEQEKNKKILFESQFESFWNLYDKKKSRPDAEKKFKAALKIDTYENIIAGVEKYIKARSPDSQYWKNPSTWLNQECWKDDYSTPKSESTTFNPTKWSKY
jgi:uncharacterized protein YdaU (DUF1376 family)